MNAISTQAALSRPQLLHQLPGHATHFDPEIFIPSTAPWLYTTLSQLWDLESGGALVPGVGDLRVEARTAIRVRKLLSRIGGNHDLPVPTVNVFSGGGLSLLWQVGSREVKYTFWPEGVITFWKEQEGQDPSAEELADDNAFNPRDQIEWLLKP